MLLRTWSENDFALLMYDTGSSRSDGKAVLGYHLYDFGWSTTPIFSGEDFSPGAAMSLDGDEAVAGLLGFLSLREGDTDDEYFADYTAEQREWSRCHAEELAILVFDLENPEG